MIRVTAIKQALTFILAFSVQQQLFAQKKVNQQLFREFIQVCNVYKQTPLHAYIEMKRSSNMAATGSDTVQSFADYYMKGSEGYIKFDDAEQFISDSLFLTVLMNSRQMIIYNKTGAFETFVRSMPGMVANDAVLKDLNDRYSIRKENLDKNRRLEMNSRKILYNTDIPVETVVVVYDEKKQWPLSITTIKRSLLLKNKQDINQPGTNAYPAIREIMVEDRGLCIVKEETNAFIFTTIEHDEHMQLPVQIADRITKKETGFVPVKEFENYLVIKH